MKGKWQYIFAMLIGLGAWGLGYGAELVISQIAPFSGPLAPTGSHLRGGAQLYFDVVNGAGGINGARIRFLARDDAYKAEETVRLVKESLKADRPVALFGAVGTGNVEALLKEKVLEEAGVPLVTVRTGAQTVLRSGNPWVFATRASYADEIRALLELYLPLGFKRIGVLYQDDGFGKDGLSATEALLKEKGLSLVAKGSYEKNTTKVDEAVKVLAAADPALVILVANTAACAEFVKQFRALGKTATLATLSTTDGPQVASRIGKDVARGLALSQVAPDPHNGALALVREIQNAARRYPPKDVSVNQTFIEGYVGAKVLVEALRKLGPQPTPRKLREALEQLHDLDLGGLTIGFSGQSHLGSTYVDVTILSREGVLVR